MSEEVGEVELEDNDFKLYEYTDEEKLSYKDAADKIKSKYKVGKVYLLKVQGEEGDEKEEYKAWIKKPDLTVFSMFTSQVQKGKTVEACKAVINSCFLEGDEEIRKDDEIFMGAMGQIQELMSIRQAKIAKF